MPRLSRSKLIRKWYRWSLSNERRETPREVEARRQAEARRAARGFV